MTLSVADLLRRCQHRENNLQNSYVRRRNWDTREDRLLCTSNFRSQNYIFRTSDVPLVSFVKSGTATLGGGTELPALCDKSDSLLNLLLMGDRLSCILRDLQRLPMKIIGCHIFQNGGDLRNTVVFLVYLLYKTSKLRIQ